MSNPLAIYREKAETVARTLRPRKARVAVLGCAVAALGVALLGSPSHNPLQVERAFAQDAMRGAPGFADVADKVRPAVVSIFTKGSSGAETRMPGAPGGPGGPGSPGGREFNFPELPPEHPFHDFFEQFRRGMPDNNSPMPRAPERAQGSGFLISADGYVVTNNHVVEKAGEISLTFESEEKYTAKVVGTDPRTDIALLKIDGDKKFTNYLEFANTKPRVGDWVLAVGNPFGLGGTVTAGIVSAGGRSIGAGPYDFLQIDAAVNRGNSGGPSVNLQGQVIGVNTAIYSPSGGNVGIAFAIPSDLAKNVIDQLKSSGKVARGWLGVTIQDVNEDIAESLGLKDAKGALVTKIMDDGPSAKSDLKVRDVVVEVNGAAIANSRDLARKIADLPPDSPAKLTVVRDGKQQPANVKLGTFPNSDRLASLEQDAPGKADEMKELGLTLSPAGELQGAGDEGVAITEVDPRSEASEKGLKAGDVILEVGGKTVTRPSQVVDGIREAKEKGRKAVLMQVKSSRQSRFIALSLENKKG